MGSHCMCGTLLRLLLCSAYKWTSSVEALQSKEACEHLSSTHRSRVCRYSTYNGIFSYHSFKQSVQTYGKQIRYYGVGYHHQNRIVERSIKELALGSQNLLFHSTRIWPEVVNTILWPFSLGSACHRHNNLEMEEEGRISEPIFSG